jgi:hypothetical protein
MTRKHFEVMAEMVRDLTLSDEDREHLISTMCRTFKGINGRFDPDRFRAACMGQPVLTRR